jgi:hypothetical protein
MQKKSAEKDGDVGGRAEGARRPGEASRSFGASHRSSHFDPAAAFKPNNTPKSSSNDNANTVNKLKPPPWL